MLSLSVNAQRGRWGGGHYCGGYHGSYIHNNYSYGYRGYGYRPIIRTYFGPRRVWWAGHWGYNSLGIYVWFPGYWYLVY